MKDEPQDSCTWKELMESTKKLAADPELRKKVEEGFRAANPDCHVYIDELGVGHITAKEIYISNMINKEKKK